MATTSSGLFHFIENMPAWQLATSCSLFFVALTWIGIVFIKPFLQFGLRNEPDSNTLVAQASSGFSLFYGLLLGLLSVAAYQNTQNVMQYVASEASTLGVMYRGLGAYPEPLRSELQYLVRDYTQYVIREEFPAHREGRTPDGGSLRMQTLATRLIEFEPATKTQEILHGQILDQFNNLIDARQHRLNGVYSGIPGVMWYVVGIGAVINLILIWMLRMRFWTHLFLGGLVSFFLGVMIFLIIVMDRPLRGEASIGPDTYQRTYDLVMRWDET
ncbi:MAG: hypothetical protein U1E45_19815 [Geminicoccaceae bacterium]